jgi:hypothetical protein
MPPDAPPSNCRKSDAALVNEKSILEQFTDVLERHGAEYIVIGGQAELLMGSPRVTYDVDLCYRRTAENLNRLAAALQELRVTLRGAPADLPFKADAKTLQMGSNFTLSTPFGALDLLGYVEPIGEYADVLKNSEVYPADGYELRTIGLEDLIRIKQHIRRFKDSESLYELLAIKRIRDAQSGGQPPPR